MQTGNGHYRHRGVTLAWDEQGLSLRRTDAATVRVAWADVQGARRTGALPGHVEVLVRDPASPAGPWLHALELAVNSGPDADRLLTTINWWAAESRADAPPAPTRWGPLRLRAHRADRTHRADRAHRGDRAHLATADAETPDVAPSIAERDRLNRLSLEREVAHVRRTRGERAARRARRVLTAALEDQRSAMIEKHLRS